MKNYFSHDEGARNDPKLIKVLMRLGQPGKGVYWDLVEMLYEQDGYLMRSDCESYAFALRTDNDLLKSLINDFDLFTSDDVRFWSDSVLRRLLVRKSKSLKASESAQKRWSDANALRLQSEGNAIKEKERKEKEKKEREEKKKGAGAPPPENVGDQSIPDSTTPSVFEATWQNLINSPKWKNKTASALQLALNKIKTYDERFGIELMEKAIIGNYQGVVYADTSADYQKWAAGQGVRGGVVGTTFTKTGSVGREIT